MSDDPHRALCDRTIASVLDGPGTTPAELRRAVAKGEPPAEIRTLVERIHREPWTVTDGDWAPLRAKYPDEDQQFEIVVAAAVGAARERFDAAMRALEEA